MVAEQGSIQVSVWRSKSQAYETFEAPRQASQTVLDVVTWIQQNADPSLAYRFACRVGMCGSCAMMVNGRPRWTCRTHVDRALDGGDTLEIGPLRNLPVIRDLATDMNPFFEKWVAADAVFEPSTNREAPMAPILPENPRRQIADAGIECINCAICYSACDTVAGNPDFLGPAALNRAWTLVNDERDGGQAERLAALSGHGGCHNCHSTGACQAVCPNDLNPTAAIAGLKRATVRAAFRRGG